MTRKSFIVLSAVLFVFAVLFIVAGVILFNYVPSGDYSAGYADPKQALAVMGCFFSFLFALGCFAGFVFTLVNALNYRGY